VKYPILILGAAVALIAADPTPAPSSSPSAVFSPSPLFSPGTFVTPTVSTSPGSTPEATEPPAIFGPRHGTPAHPRATPSPIPDARKGLDGVWEVQIQRGSDTQYEHFSIKQTGTSLIGTYLTTDKKKYPVAGTLDGSNVRLVVSLADGTTILLEAKVDGTTDMLGMFTDAKERIPFTAAYRPKEKWIDNLNAQPGGLGGQGGYQPPR
jgi:hypothetical protein